ncbi:hypothetical protein GCM10023187_43220 [Nibrella viscosa]|uniref:Uncharacterized protein n=1 Tax=Nibrella viscosa TaxID=1084524 RepID=A0ABP8KRC3_9BACT
MLLFSITGQAQQDTYAEEANYSGKGHWKLFTDNQSHSTIIKFYNAERRLVYEEVLAGKYIKLTDQNVYLINRVFDQIMENRLIAGSVKSAPLEAVMVSNRTAVWTGPALKPESIAGVNVHNGLNYNIGLNTHLTDYNARQMLHVQVDNPERYRLYIRLQDRNGQTIYAETVTQPACLVKLNLTQLKAESYTLEVATPNKKYTYERKIVLGVATPSTRFNHSAFANTQ